MKSKMKRSKKTKKKQIHKLNKKGSRLKLMDSKKGIITNLRMRKKFRMRKS